MSRRSYRLRSYVRVYAFSGGNKRLMIFLILYWTGINIVTGLYLHKFLLSVVCSPRCFPAQAEGLGLAVNIGTLIAGVSSICQLATACNSLLKVFYQDGIFYFIGLTMGRAIHFAVPNIYWRNVFQNNGMKLLTIQPLARVHFGALVTTRMLLHLREFAAIQHIVMASGTFERYAMDDLTPEGNAGVLSAFGSLGIAWSSKMLRMGFETTILCPVLREFGSGGANPLVLHLRQSPKPGFCPRSFLVLHPKSPRIARPSTS
ncbi:hypothetical protein FA13DRAFT_1708745 [Coprinellus micaceus]|uniref:Uncharacterized protein n=1 Tax=Coprinellus micaceus TaxID=71717 RepID=A0A4Y7TEX5_COPMI|nr:hypothetical protein FA13DRAFT_1708745 [Coprinellus micaceus]